MPRDTVVFVCDHGAAKSVVAAAYFNRLAKERGLALHAVPRGTDPDEALGPKAVAGLAADGLAPGVERPVKLSADDAARAARIVAFCDLADFDAKGAPVERWDEVPPVGKDHGAARDAIVKRVEEMVGKGT